MGFAVRERNGVFVRTVDAQGPAAEVPAPHTRRSLSPQSPDLSSRSRFDAQGVDSASGIDWTLDKVDADCMWMWNCRRARCGLAIACTPSTTRVFSTRPTSGCASAPFSASLFLCSLSSMRRSRAECSVERRSTPRKRSRLETTTHRIKLDAL